LVIRGSVSCICRQRHRGRNAAASAWSTIGAG
jgi:hypothetical protein